jgi:integrase
MKVKYNMVIAPKTRGGVEENLPIRLRITFNGNRLEFGTGYSIDLAKWDFVKQRVKNGCTNKFKQSSSQINADLSKLEAKVDDIFRSFELQDITPSADLFRTAFQGDKQNESAKGIKPVKARKATPSLWEVFDIFVKECGRMNDWTESTYEKFAAAKNHLTNFDSKITFEALDESRLNDYVLYLRNTKNLRNSTIGKQVGFVKWFLRWAFRKGYHQNQSFELFKPKLKYAMRVVVFLTEAELRTIRDYQVPKHKRYLERVRDVFLFCCYTGLRYSDVYGLRKSDIKEDEIEIVTVKTLDKLIIELTKQSREILAKYEDVDFPNDKALPVVSNQNMNNYIKELCELAGIDAPITQSHFKGNERIDKTYPKYSIVGTHTGRRTFICNALSSGVPVQVVMKWTGHSDFKSMRPYIDVSDPVKRREMDKLSDYLS